MKYRDIIQLGRHKLMCGDACKTEDISRLIAGSKNIDFILTDPPYGMKIQDKSGCIGGAGTTLLACEVTGRTCLMMELSPEYCEITAERYRSVKENYCIGV